MTLSITISSGFQAIKVSYGKEAVAVIFSMWVLSLEYKEGREEAEREEEENSISYLLCYSEILLIYNNHLGSYSLSCFEKTPI